MTWPRQLTFPVRMLNEALSCPLCKGYLRDAHTIAECLHTFCKTCVFTYFDDEDNHACPVCGVVLRPSPLSYLRQDRTMQSIVDHVLPNLEAADKAAEEEYYRTSGAQRPSSSTAPASVRGASRSLKDDEEPARRHHRKPTVVQLREGRAYPDSATIELQPEKDAPVAPLPMPFVKTTRHAPVSVLKKYLRTELRLGPTLPLDQIEVLYQGEALDQEKSIDWVVKTHGIDVLVPLFTYRRRRSPRDSPVPPSSP
eukprot:m51a1_g5945 hypothetical protein (254) ;mRNA; r:124659-125644